MTNTPHPTPEEINAALAGLEEAKRRGPALRSLRNGRHVRQQLFLTVEEHALRQLMSYVLALHMRRPVSQALIARLAFRVLAEECRKSLRDPMVAARLKAELIATREEKPA